MKRLFLGIAALGLLLVTTESASARPWYGVSAGYGYGGPYYGVSYGTRVGNSGFLSVGYSSGFGGYAYPAYGYSYAAPAYYSAPVYDYSYVAPVYSAPVYYSTPVYYSSPSFGFSYYRSGWGRRGWGW